MDGLDRWALSVSGVLEIKRGPRADQTGESGKDDCKQVLRFGPVAELVGITGESDHTEENKDEQTQIRCSNPVASALLL